MRPHHANPIHLRQKEEGLRAFPLQVSYATSNHKMQGQTCGKGCATTHVLLPPSPPPKLCH